MITFKCRPKEKRRNKDQTVVEEHVRINELGKLNCLILVSFPKEVL